MRSVRENDSKITFPLEHEAFSDVGCERSIHMPAREICIHLEDLSPKWREKAVKMLEEPKFGQCDYAVRHFCMFSDNTEIATVSFETIIYSDQEAAAKVFLGTLNKMSFLQVTKLKLGDASALIEAPGHPSKRMRTLIFMKQNVMGLIMLSNFFDHDLPHSWLIDMGHLMTSRVI